VRVLDDLSSGSRDNLARHPGLELLVDDLRDAAACRRGCRGVSSVFHLAALGSVPGSIEDPAATIDVNVGGTAKLFAAAREEGVGRIVYASSSAVYGDAGRLPSREGEEGEPLSPYGLSKRMGEELAACFARCFGLELVGLRYFNVYGPRQSPEGAYAAVVARFLAAALAGTPMEIHGDGEQSRDFTHVDDAVAATLLAAGAPAEACGRAYNVAGGVRVTIRELAALLAATAGSDAPPRHLPVRPGDVRQSQADLAAARRALGYAPCVPLQEGLRRLWEHAMAAVPGR
jgi:nucleoside-diphosphate-sugar epimerase